MVSSRCIFIIKLLAFVTCYWSDLQVNLIRLAKHRTLSFPVWRGSDSYPHEATYPYSQWKPSPYIHRFAPLSRSDVKWHKNTSIAQTLRRSGYNLKVPVHNSEAKYGRCGTRDKRIIHNGAAWPCPRPRPRPLLCIVGYATGYWLLAGRLS